MPDFFSFGKKKEKKEKREQLEKRRVTLGDISGPLNFRRTMTVSNLDELTPEKIKYLIQDPKHNKPYEESTYASLDDKQWTHSLDMNRPRLGPTRNRSSTYNEYTAFNIGGTLPRTAKPRLDDDRVSNYLSPSPLNSPVIEPRSERIYENHIRSSPLCSPVNNHDYENYLSPLSKSPLRERSISILDQTIPFEDNRKSNTYDAFVWSNGGRSISEQPAPIINSRSRSIDIQRFRENSEPSSEYGSMEFLAHSNIVINDGYVYKRDSEDSERYPTLSSSTGGTVRSILKYRKNTASTPTPSVSPMAPPRRIRTPNYEGDLLIDKLQSSTCSMKLETTSTLSSHYVGLSHDPKRQSTKSKQEEGHKQQQQQQRHEQQQQQQQAKKKEEKIDVPPTSPTSGTHALTTVSSTSSRQNKGSDDSGIESSRRISSDEEEVIIYRL